MIWYKRLSLFCPKNILISATRLRSRSRIFLIGKRLKKSIQKTNSVFLVHFTVAPNLRQRIRLPDTCQIGFFSIGILSSIFGRDVRFRWMRLLLMFWCMKLVTISDFPMRICGGVVTPLRTCGSAGGSVAKGMKKISYRGYRFPPEIIHQAIWLYLRFTLSLRDVEDLWAERGIMVSYETVRRWVNHFGPMIAADLRKRRPKPHTTWHLDEVYLKIAGRMVYLWRAVDAEGEVLDVLVQSRRNKRAALKLMRKLLKKYGFVPDKLVTDDLRSYAAAANDLGIARRHERGR